MHHDFKNIDILNTCVIQSFTVLILITDVFMNLVSWLVLVTKIRIHGWLVLAFESAV